ncbi:MAG: ornithine carbamoyltransferase [Pseudomonadota bacterium]
MQLSTKHLLAIGDLEPADILNLVARAAELKAGWLNGYRPRPLADKTVALIFQKASTRTRVSFEVGTRQLGGTSLFMTDRDSQLGRSEPLKDTARVLSRYVDAMVVRTFGQEVLSELASYASIPVINALSDASHPCQVLSDLLTVREQRGRIEGLAYAWIGDGNNMANSWLAAAGHLGLDLRLACPQGFDPDPRVLEVARARGGRILLTRDPKEAVAGADVINTDVWASMGQEGEAEQRRRAFAGFRVDAGLLALAQAEAMVLHCLPAHRGEEISDEVLEGPKAPVWDQAENRLHMQKAIMEALIA